MTLNFPNAPTNGQVFQGYQYSTPKGVWQAFPQVNPGQYGAVPGSIMLWFSDVIPTAALAMEGQTITGGVALFPALAAIYPAWVSGANLVLPDTRGRVLVGRDATQSEFNALGAASGFKTHTLTVAEMPSHTHVQNAHNHTQNEHGHNVSDPGHNHSQNAHGHPIWNTGSSPNGDFVGLSGGTQGGWGLAGGTNNQIFRLTPQNTTATNNASSSNVSVIGNTATNQTTTATNQNSGSGEAHNNLQPYIVARYIVWAASIVGQYDPIVQQALVASVTALTSKTSNIAVVQVDTTSRSAGQAWVVGPTFADITGFKANSRLKLFYHIPMRNNSSSWGGVYIEPQVSFNGGTYQSLGSTGYENMTLNGPDILAYNNTLLINPLIVDSVFSAQFRILFRSYDGTVLWGSAGKDINALSGTATLLSGDNGTQHHPHIIVEEIPA